MERLAAGVGVASVAVGDAEAELVGENVSRARLGVGEPSKASEETVGEVVRAEGDGIDGCVQDVSSGGSCSGNASAAPAPSMVAMGKELSLGEGLFS